MAYITDELALFATLAPNSCTKKQVARGPVDFIFVGVPVYTNAYPFGSAVHRSRLALDKTIATGMCKVPDDVSVLLQKGSEPPMGSWLGRLDLSQMRVSSLFQSHRER